MCHAGDRDFAIEYGFQEYVHLTKQDALIVYVDELEDGRKPSDFHYDGRRINLREFRKLVGIN